TGLCTRDCDKQIDGAREHPDDIHPRVWTSQYRLAHPGDFDDVASEIAAIKSSLTLLPKEGLESLAFREARAIREMANRDPYRSAVQRLADDPIWIKYSR